MHNADFDSAASFEHAREAIESAFSEEEVVGALGAYADETGELALQVFPEELRSGAGVASLAVEITRLGMRHGLEEDREWRDMETLFARATVRLSELQHPSTSTARAPFSRASASASNRPPSRTR